MEKCVRAAGLKVRASRNYFSRNFDPTLHGRDLVGAWRLTWVIASSRDRSWAITRTLTHHVQKCCHRSTLLLNHDISVEHVAIPGLRAAVN